MIYLKFDCSPNSYKSIALKFDCSPNSFKLIVLKFDCSLISYSFVQVSIFKLTTRKNRVIAEENEMADAEINYILETHMISRHVNWWLLRSKYIASIKNISLPTNRMRSISLQYSASPNRMLIIPLQVF